MNRTRKGTGKTFSIHVIGKLLSVALSLSLLPVMTRRMPKAEFGAVGIFWLFFPLFRRLVTLGTDVGVSIRFFKEDKEDLCISLYSSILCMFVMSVVLWVVGFVRPDWAASALGDDVTVGSLTLVVGLCLASALGQTMLSLLQNESRAAWQAFLTIAPTVITTSTTFLLVVYVSASYRSYLLGVASGEFALGITAVVYLLVRYPIVNFRPSATRTFELLRIGLPSLPGAVGGIILSAGDRYMIKHYLGLEAVAVYTLGYRFAAQVADGLFLPFQRAFSPVVCRKAAVNVAEARAYSIQATNRAVLAFSAAIAVALVGFQDVLVIVATNAYGGSYAVFMTSLVGLLLLTIAGAETELLMFKEQTASVMATTLSAAAINVGLNALFIPIFGYMAAAYTTVVSYFIMLSARNLMLRRLLAKRSLGQILGRLLPLVIYMTAVFLLDTWVGTILSRYALKTTSLVLFLTAIWHIYPEFRADVEKLKRGVVKACGQLYPGGKQ